MDVFGVVAVATAIAGPVWLVFHHKPRAFQRISIAVLQPCANAVFLYFSAAAGIAISEWNRDMGHGLMVVFMWAGAGLCGFIALLFALHIIRRLDEEDGEH